MAPTQLWATGSPICSPGLWALGPPPRLSSTRLFGEGRWLCWWGTSCWGRCWEPSAPREGWEDGVGQGVVRRPKLHMGFAVPTAPLEPVDWHRSNAGQRGGEHAGGTRGRRAQLRCEGLGALPAPQPLRTQPHAS